MPIYEYECRECGYRFDALQKMSDPPLTDCPACGQPSLKKLLSAPHFRLKGSGWYETDFKNSGRQKPDASGAGDQSKPAAGNGKDAGKKPGKKEAAGSAGGESSAKSAASGAGADSG
ncbi:MAG: zinc ribbon domain-containing protein [Gammaproteobacteria bacterium]|nr:zinc ribbon domain-containing protein [Gammaproteobacteria bacterium]